MFRNCMIALAAPLLFHAPAIGAVSPEEAEKIAGQGFLYGYPLVVMDLSRGVMTHATKPERTRAPANQFNVSEEFPDPSFTDVVSPNADTLYSMSWLDLSNEPIVLSLPDTGDRYYLMQMLDAWTNVFASPGTRTTGNRAGDYAIVGPNFQGTLPTGLKEIKSPTSMVWMIGRTQTNGPGDYAAVRELKAKYRLTPLSAWGADYSPPADVPLDPTIDADAPPVKQSLELDAAKFFDRLARLMVDNPPAAADAPMIEELAKIGVVPGEPFELAKLDAAAAAAVERGFAAAHAALLAAGKALDDEPPVNGWSVTMNVGDYGTDYHQRAVIALVGLGANLPADAVYPMTSIDGAGQPLTGANKYAITFAKDQIPPVRAFWSLTMYDAKHFFVANPLDRYALGNRDQLQFADDGSLTLYLQHESPGADREPNWLPTPADEFNVIMRLYWPMPSVLDGAWKPPAIVRIP